MKTGDAEHRRKKHRVTEAPPTSAAGEVPQGSGVGMLAKGEALVVEVAKALEGDRSREASSQGL